MGILLIIVLVGMIAIALGLAWRHGYYNHAPSSMDGTLGTGGAADTSGAHGIDMSDCGGGD